MTKFSIIRRFFGKISKILMIENKKKLRFHFGTKMDNKESIYIINPKKTWIPLYSGK